MSAGTDLAAPTAVATPPGAAADDAEAIDTLRRLAGQGRLASTFATASAAERRRLTGAAYALAVPIVYQRLTRRVEHGRGHPECARSMRGLADSCLDRFHDDVESVVDYLLAHATKPIRRVESWMASRLHPATVDGYRKRRGKRGAPQRPRLSARLAQALGHDQWLTTLAIELLEWVGVSATAGTGLWPLDAWAARRAEVTGDWAGSDPATVLADIEVVLAALRRRPGWYESNVEAPLGRKQAPVAPAPAPGTEHMALSLADPDAADDAHLYGLAADALAQLHTRLARGADPQVVVVEVVGTVFGSGTGQHELGRPPYAASPYEEQVRQLLGDPADVRRIVDDVLSIIVDA